MGYLTYFSATCLKVIIVLSSGYILGELFIAGQACWRAVLVFCAVIVAASAGLAFDEGFFAGRNLEDSKKTVENGNEDKEERSVEV